ncbi:hypothetical protein J4Q44_G00253410 [Coregonus suidteri]|uniref:Uncharacterized protein n=1 Tax=Coregonus suidteri TaxID=861788 RepID=A0AAN8L8S8_9TELE
MATCMLSSKMSPIIRFVLKEQYYSSRPIYNGVTEISRRGENIILATRQMEMLSPSLLQKTAMPPQRTADCWSTTPVWSGTGRCERTRIRKTWFRPGIKCTKPYEVTETSLRPYFRRYRENNGYGHVLLTWRQRRKRGSISMALCWMDTSTLKKPAEEQRWEDG